MDANYSAERISLIRRWTNCGEEVKIVLAHGRGAKADPSKLDQFRGRYKILEKYYSRFEELTEELTDFHLKVPAPEVDEAAGGEPAVPVIFPDAAQSKVIANIRNFYMECHEIHALLCRPETSQSMPNITMSQDGNSSSSALPKISIPKFGGEFAHWVLFRDTFDSMVHNTTLSPTQKFHHLVSALTGEARSVISSFTISDANYPLAYKALRDTYDNPRVLASMFLNKLLDCQPSTKASSDSYKKFLSEVSDRVSALELIQAIPKLSDFILFHLASRWLDASTREQFELKVGKNAFPTVAQLTDFVRERLLALQLADPQSTFTVNKTPEDNRKAPNNKAFKRKEGAAPKTSLLTSSNNKASEPKKESKSSSESSACHICQEAHRLITCAKFHNLTPRQRFEGLRGWSGCRICLGNNHKTQDCRSKRPECRLCSEKHNTMLCLKSTEPKEKINSPSANLFGATLNTAHSSKSSPGEESQVILATAIANVRDARGEFQTVRVVLDSASQFSYMTQRCLFRLGLPLSKTPRKISCLGGVLFDAAKGVSQCEFASTDKQTTLSTEVVIVKNITSALPTIPVPSTIWKRYIKYDLADKTWYRPGTIDALIGADIFPLITKGTFVSVGDDIPHLLPTIFGMVLLGRCIQSCPSTPPSTSLFSLSHCEDNLCFDLQKFWEVEEIVSSEPLHSQEEDLAEESFLKTHYRLPDGKFGVHLPFKHQVPDLSGSENIAKRRFFNLESKLKRNPELKAQYTAFMEEYEQLGHMAPASTPSNYVIPHHGVFNKVKLRVVFDASCQTPSGSLNDHLLIGRPLQNDIRSILLNFRTYKWAFITDAVKMYRQIEVRPEDRAHQHIFWRADPAQPLQKYELNTVTYGMACSPFLALRCLKQLELENAEKFPLAAQALSTQLYVDDIAAGSSSEGEALELQRQLQTVMTSGGFQLSKWASNSHAILKAVEAESALQNSIDFSSDNLPSVKVLGLKWDPNTDKFSYSLQDPASAATKRGILSTVARIFDPLGFLAPSVVVFKVLIQKLWREGLSWDDQVPDHILTQWQELTSKLNLLSQVQIDRWVIRDQPYTYQLIGFSDASETAYCAAVYIRIISKNSITVRLLTSKTRVAPTKRLTIPKLELCGALLLAKLMASLTQFQKIVSTDAFPNLYFSDSMVTLAWIQTPPHKLKVFVANRVAEIQGLSPSNAWHHVAGIDNPADLGSRGVLPDNLVHNQLWWSGPPWLAEPMSKWPSTNGEGCPALSNLPEMKDNPKGPSATLFSCSDLPSLVDWMDRFSSYRTLIRVTALILRIIHNRKCKDRPRSGAYLLVEINQAFFACIRLVQLHGFLQGNLKNMSKVEATYQSLSPFLDKEGIIRVGGRLNKAQISPSQRHQVLLPAESHFSKILIDFYHLAFHHPGPNHLQALLQIRFWIPGLRRLVRQRTRKCLPCYKLRAKAVIPSMGSLPEYRLQSGRAFLHCGIDFAGPFTMRESSRRKANTSKVYLCLFVCMATKALHLEAVTSLTTEAFLASLSRFIARRGLPCDVYTDCGSNFVGAARELKELNQWYADERTQEDIINFSAQRSVRWHFNPPYTPHFGGLWEAGVRSVKRHLKLVASDTPLTFEELSTLFCNIEAILNSRPLCPLSDDPSESNYLSPAHFLIGEVLTSPPEPTLLDVGINKLSRWQLIKRMREQVWARWRLEYLSTLQKRTKWHRQPAHGLQKDDLVLIKCSDTPPLHWPMGKIAEVHPGDDGQVRVVTIKTANSVVKRSTANLIPLLPLKDESDD